MFVAGCHRSGTSLVAGVVSGLLRQHTAVDPEVPGFEDLPPALDNPAGFFESQLLTQLNDRCSSRSCAIGVIRLSCRFSRVSPIGKD